MWIKNRPGWLLPPLLLLGLSQQYEKVKMVYSIEIRKQSIWNYNIPYNTTSMYIIPTWVHCRYWSFLFVSSPQGFEEVWEEDNEGQVNSKAEEEMLVWLLDDLKSEITERSSRSTWSSVPSDSLTLPCSLRPKTTKVFATAMNICVVWLSLWQLDFRLKKEHDLSDIL